MTLYKQSDKKWSSIIMTSQDDLKAIDVVELSKRWPNKIDTIGAVGCMVVTGCNITKYKNPTNPTNPSKLNDYLRNHKGYKVLAKGKDCPVQQESFIEWPVFMRALGIVHIDRYWKGHISIEHPKFYYIVRAPYNPPHYMGGHYCLLVGYSEGIYVYFDPDSGEYRTDWEYDDSKYFIHRVQFK